MRYELHTGNYCNFNIFEENKEAPQAYFIPHRTLDSLESTDFRSERYHSDAVILLSGKPLSIPAQSAENPEGYPGRGLSSRV